MNGIKVVENGKIPHKLFRANKDLYNNNERLIYVANKNKNILASVNYTNAPVKYFTLNKEEVSAYTKNGKTYIKNWNVIEKLNLIDILDLTTRRTLQNRFMNDNDFQVALSKAFPIMNNEVRRISSSVTQDNKVLNKICEMGYDGYYMEAQDSLTSKNEKSFHSEVGLCNEAFKKLKLANKPEKREAAPRINKKTLRRNQRNNRHNTMRRRLFNTNNNSQPVARGLFF
jgi:hypothetical protein